MTEIEEIIDELHRIHDGDAWHGPSLHEILDGVTASQAAAKPIGAAHSIWELVLHIAGWEHAFTRRLEGYPDNEPEEGDFPPVTNASKVAWQEAQAKLDTVHQRLIEVVSVLNTERLSETVVGKDYSVRFLLRGLTRHHVYHTGQIALLKKA